MSVETKTWWWLAEVCRYGYADKLVDGPHSDRAGVERAAYLYKALKLGNGKEYGCVAVRQTAVKPKSRGVNKSAVDLINAFRSAS